MAGNLGMFPAHSSASGLFRALTSAGSIAIHCLVLSILFASSMLHLEPLAEPSIQGVLFASDPFLRERPIETKMTGPSASSSAPPPQGGAPRQAASQADAPVQETQPVTQAVELPEQIPGSDPGAGGNGGDGATEGIPGGIPDGIPGGGEGSGGAGGWGPGGDGRGALRGLGDDPVLLGSNVTPPEKIFHVRPEYPEVARKSRTPGVVILEIVVGRSGTVEDVKILKSHPLFDAAAIEAVRRWKYRPAMMGERPVRVFLTVRVEFALK